MAFYVNHVVVPGRQRILFGIFAVLAWVGLIGYWIPIVKSGNWPPLDLTLIFMMIISPIGNAGLS